MKPHYASRQYIQVFMSLFSWTGKENRDITLKAMRCMPLTSVLVAPKDTLTWPSKGACVWNSNLEQLCRTLWLSSPTRNVRTLSRLAATEMSSTTSAVKHETKEISDYLNRDPECSKMFYEVYPADKIPKLCLLPVLIVCNTDTSSKRGEQWIVL